MKKILLFGEPMGLFVAEEIGELEDVKKFHKSVSGAELNVAIGLKRLGHDPYYVTKLGEDVLGKYIYNFIKSEKINTNYIKFDKYHQTGIQLKNKVRSGDAQAPYFRKHSAASTMSLNDIEELDFTQFDHIHITGVSLAISSSFRDMIYYVIETARQHDITISFDPNIRKSLWANEREMIAIINDVAFRSDFFLPGISEAKLLSGLSTEEDISEYYLSRGIVKAVVIKQGAKGAYYNDGIESGNVYGFEVDEIVDTVGAGDGFTAGFISMFLEGKDIKTAVKYANGVGAIQLNHWSDNQGLPTRRELDYFIKTKKVVTNE